MNQQISKYIISASAAESMAESKGLTVPQLLPSLVNSAQQLSSPPISNFRVGAVGLASDGRIFFGGNVEFPGLPLNHSIHAEQFLITNAAVHGGGPRLLYIAVSAAPCGHCRQFLQELRGVSDTQIVITDQAQEKNPDYIPISSILPNPFGPLDLLDREMPLILEKHDNQLTFKGQPFVSQNENLSNGYTELVKKNVGNLKKEALEAARGSHAPYSKCPSGVALMDYEGGNENLSNGYTELVKKNMAKLEKEALTAARGSHAPYSGCPSGVALMDCEGEVYKGCYMESAAYNPSMMPLQAALVAYMVAGGGGYERIVAAVMVEKEAAMVRQEETARLLLNHVSPKCELRVVHCICISSHISKAG